MPTVPIAKKNHKDISFERISSCLREKYGFLISICSVTDTGTGQKTSVM